MALEQYHHLKHNSTKIQVDSAIRDGNGAKIDTTYVKLSNLVDSIYPIGSYYTSANNTNPATLFGGTWEELVRIGTENESTGQIDVTVYMWKRTA